MCSLIHYVKRHLIQGGHHKISRTNWSDLSNDSSKLLFHHILWLSNVGYFLFASKLIIDSLLGTIEDTRVTIRPSTIRRHAREDTPKPIWSPIASPEKRNGRINSQHQISSSQIRHWDDHIGCQVVDGSGFLTLNLLIKEEEYI